MTSILFQRFIYRLRSHLTLFNLVHLSVLLLYRILSNILYGHVAAWDSLRMYLKSALS
jgi:hypothetical protein